MKLVLRVVVLVCLSLVGRPAGANVQLFDSPFEREGAMKEWQSPQEGGAAAWSPQGRQGIVALESRGRDATLSRDVRVAGGEPFSVVVAHGWRAGRGAGALRMRLSDATGEGVSILMRQADGKKYEIAWDAGQETRSIGALEDPTLDAGVQSGGVAETPAVVHVHLDAAGQALTLGRLGGGRTTVKLPRPLVPTRLALVDASAGQEQSRLSRVRAFTGATDPTEDVLDFTTPFGASFVEGQETPTVRLRGTWFSPEVRKAQVRLDVSPMLPDAGVTEAQRVVLERDLAPGERVELKVPALSNLEPGLYAFSGEAKVGERAVPVKGRFAVLSTDLAGRPQAGIPRWVGVVPFINVLPREVYPESFEYMHKLGVRHVRWLPGWGRLEPEEDRYDWRESDQFMDLVGRHGMEAMFCLSYFGADWATERTGGQLARTPEGRALWVEKFAVPTIRRYGDRVKLWQIWNEPDAFWNDDPEKAYGFAQAFATPANYMDLVRRTHVAAHHLGIGGLRIMASLASGEIPQQTRRLFKLGLGEHFDGMIIHTYGPHARHFQNLRRLLAELGHPNPALGSGEMGLPRGTDWTGSMRQARAVMQTMLSSTTIPDLLCVEWFVLHDKVAGGNFGLIDENYQPHPAGVAYHTVARLLSGATSGTMETRGLLTIFRVERDGRPPLVAVANVDNPTLLRLRAKGGQQPVVWDLLGRAARPEVRDGLFTVDVAEAVMVEGEVTVETAISPAVTITIDEAGQPVVRVAVGAGQGDGESSVTLSVPTLNFNEKRSLDAQGETVFKLPQALEPGRQYPGELTVAVAGSQVRQPTTIEATPIYRVSDAQAKQLDAPVHLPAIRLDDAGVFHPFNRSRTWGGTTDNSATIRMGWTNDDVILWVEQEDDRHAPIPPGAPNPFGFDSGQWAFQPQGQLAPAATALDAVFGILADGTSIARVLGQPHYSPKVEHDQAGTRRRYRVSMPLAQLGIVPGHGVSFGTALNLNDNDGDGRKGWLYWGQGINVQRNAAQFRRVVMHADLGPAAR